MDVDSFAHPPKKGSIMAGFHSSLARTDGQLFVRQKFGLNIKNRTSGLRGKKEKGLFLALPVVFRKASSEEVSLETKIASLLTSTSCP